jgi:hypothetical protein
MRPIRPISTGGRLAAQLHGHFAAEQQCSAVQYCPTFITPLATALLSFPLCFRERLNTQEPKKREQGSKR